MTRKTFFDAVRKAPFGGSLTASQVMGMNAILDAWEGTADLRFPAYALATVVVETGHSMQPIKEKGGVAYFTKMYDIKGSRPKKARELGNLTPGDGARYCGRGYVQLTGKSNYAKLGQLVGVDLVASPDRAMEPAIAAAVMVVGMTRGLFTGAKLSQFFTATKSNWRDARTIINSHDRADEIAGYARQFFAALTTAAAAAEPADISLVAPAPPTESPAPMPYNPVADAVQAIGAKAFDAVISKNPALAVGGAIIKAALDKPHVQIEFKDVPAAATEVMSTIADSKVVTLAPVKSSWESKKNWLNGAFATGVATFLGFNIPQTPEQWAAAITALVVPILTVVLQTWFSPSVTAASAGK